jgi:hypothetical protein
MSVKNGLSSKIRKIESHDISFSWEITIALLVKFSLLAGLWWLFFAGSKQPVDEASIADKIFGERHSTIISEKPGAS